jgi:hypothetical protein
LEKSQEATADLGDRRKRRRREHAKELLVQCCCSIWVKIPVNVLSSSAMAIWRVVVVVVVRVVFFVACCSSLPLQCRKSPSSLSLSLSLVAARKRFLGENVTLLYYIAAFLDES